MVKDCISRSKINNSNKGFTLVELIVVLTMMAIVLTLGGFAMLKWQDWSTFNQENEYAQTLFVAAQNQLSEYSANGRLEVLQMDLKSGDEYGKAVNGDNIKGIVLNVSNLISESGQAYDRASVWSEAYRIDPSGGEKADKYIDDIVAIRAGTGEYSQYINDPEGFKTSNPQAYWVYELLGSYVYDTSILDDAAICIELTPDDGQVFSVFYSDKNNSFIYSNHENKTATNGAADIVDRQETYRNEYMIGFYGVEKLTKSTRDKNQMAKAEIKNVILHNENTLNLTFDVCKAPLGELEYSVQLITGSNPSDKDVQGAFTSKLEIVVPGDKIKNNVNPVECQVYAIKADGTKTDMGFMNFPVMSQPSTVGNDEEVVLILDAADIHAGENEYRDFKDTTEKHSDNFKKTYSIFRFINEMPMEYLECAVVASGTGYIDSDESLSTNIEHMTAKSVEGSEYSLTNLRHLYNLRYLEVENGEANTYVLSNCDDTFSKDSDGTNAFDWKLFAAGFDLNGERLVYNKLYDSGKNDQTWSLESLKVSSLADCAYPSLQNFASGNEIIGGNGSQYSLKNFNISGVSNTFYQYSKNNLDASVKPAAFIILNNGKVSNVSFENGSVYTTSGCAGVVAGENYGTIQDVKISNVSVYGESRVGGYAGYNNGAITVSNGKEAISYAPNVSGAKYIGGIVGYNAASGTILNHEVKNGTVNCGESSYYVGGFVGLNESIALLQDSQNKAITIKSNPDKVTGGYFVGGCIGGNLLNTNGYSAGGNTTPTTPGSNQGGDGIVSITLGNDTHTPGNNDLQYAVDVKLTNVSEYKVKDWYIDYSELLKYDSLTVSVWDGRAYADNNGKIHPSSGNESVLENKGNSINFSVCFKASDLSTLQSIMSDVKAGALKAGASSYQASIDNNNSLNMLAITAGPNIKFAAGTPDGQIPSVWAELVYDTNNTYNYAQYKIILHNDSNSAISDWSVSFKVKSDVDLSSWYGASKYKQGDTYILASDDNWRQTIAAHGTHTLYVQVSTETNVGKEWLDNYIELIYGDVYVGGQKVYSFNGTSKPGSGNNASGIIDASFNTSLNNCQLSGNGFVGGYIGYNILVKSDSSSLKNIAENNISAVSGKSMTGAYNSMNLVANSSASDLHMRINYSDNTTVVSNNSGAINAGICVGGIVGYADDETYLDIYNTKNMSSINATYGQAGGIIGHSGAKCFIKDCVNIATVCAKNSGNAGGIAADNYGTIETCINNANITATSGICGGVVAVNNVKAEINECSVNKIDSSAESVVLSSNFSIGGIAGDNKGIILDSSVDANIYGINGSNIYGYGGIAGITGYLNNTEYANAGKVSSYIENCSFDGEINAIGSSSTWAKIGGIAGANGYGSKISNSYIGVKGSSTNSDNVTLIYSGSLSSVKSNYDTDGFSGAYVGGVAGENFGTITDIDMEKVCVKSDSDTSVNMDTINIVTNAGATGGIVGWNHSGALIEGSSTNKITTSCRMSINMRRADNDRGVGGIIGINESGKKLSYIENYANVVGNYNANMKTGGIIGSNMQQDSSQLEMEYCNNLGAVSGWANTGGFIGMDIYKGVSFHKCSNLGAVSSVNGSSSLYKYVGGFIGHVYSVGTTISFNECKNHGRIASTGSTARLAGFIGRIESCAAKNSISDCVNSGLIVDNGSAKAANFISESNGSWTLTLCRSYNTKSVDNWFVTGGKANYVYCLDMGLNYSELSYSTTKPFGGAYESSSSFNNWYLTDNFLDLATWIGSFVDNGNYPIRKKIGDNSDHPALAKVLESSVGFSMKNNNPYNSTYKRDEKYFVYSHSYGSNDIYLDYVNGLVDINCSVQHSRTAVYRDADDTFCNAVLKKQTYNKLTAPTEVEASIKSGEVKLTWKDEKNTKTQTFGYEVKYLVTAGAETLAEGSTIQVFSGDKSVEWAYPLAIDNEWAEKKATVSLEVRAISPYRYINSEGATEESKKSKDSDPVNKSVEINKVVLPKPEVHIAMTPDNKMVAVLDNIDDYTTELNLTYEGNVVKVKPSDGCEITVKWGDYTFVINTKDGNDLSKTAKTISGDSLRKLTAYAAPTTDYDEYFLQSSEYVSQGTGLTNNTLKNQVSYTTTSFNGFVDNGSGSTGYSVTYTGGDDSYLAADVGYFDSTVGAYVYTDRDVAHVASSGGADSTVSSVLNGLPQDVLDGNIDSDLIIRSYLEASQNEIISYGYVVNTVDASGLASLEDGKYIAVDASGNAAYISQSIWNADGSLKAGYTIYKNSDSYEVRYNATLANAYKNSTSYEKYAVQYKVETKLAAPSVSDVNASNVTDADNYIVNLNLVYSGSDGAYGSDVSIVATVDIVDGSGVKHEVYGKGNPLTIRDFGNGASADGVVIASIDSAEYKKIFEDHAGEKLSITIKAHSNLAIDSLWSDTKEIEIPPLAIADYTTWEEKGCSSVTEDVGDDYKVTYNQQRFGITPDENVYTYTIELETYDDTNQKISYVIEKKIESSAEKWYLIGENDSKTEIKKERTNATELSLKNEVTKEKLVDNVKALYGDDYPILGNDPASLADGFSFEAKSYIYLMEEVDETTHESTTVIVVEVPDVLDITIQKGDDIVFADSVSQYTDDSDPDNVVTTNNSYYSVKSLNVLSGFYDDNNEFVSGLNPEKKQSRVLKNNTFDIWKRENNPYLSDAGISPLSLGGPDDSDDLENPIVPDSDDPSIEDDSPEDSDNPNPEDETGDGAGANQPEGDDQDGPLPADDAPIAPAPVAGGNNDPAEGNEETPITPSTPDESDDPFDDGVAGE